MLPRGKRMTLQRSITLSILLIGLLSGTFWLGYSYWHAKHTLRHTIGLYFQELALHSADNLSLILTNEIGWVERLSALPDIRNAVLRGDRLSLDRPALQEWRNTQRHYFRSLVLVDRKGRLASGITSPSTQDYYIQQPWWPIVIDEGKPWASDIHHRPNGRDFWEMVVPIRDDRKVVIGGLKVSMETEALFAPALQLRIGETGNIMLVDASGKILLCPVLPVGLHSRIETFRAQVEHTGAKWMEVHNDGHGKQGGIIGVAPVILAGPIVQEKPWHVVVRQDPQETFAPVNTLMWKYGGFWIVVTGLFAFLGSRLTCRIVRPLGTLIAHMPLLGKDRPPSPLNIQGPQEIQTLSTNFNTLAERLQRAREETQRYVQKLEQANRELSISEDHYRMLWDHAVDSMLIVDREGIIRDMNRRAEDTIGRRDAEVLGTPSATLVVEEDQAHFTQCIDEVLTTVQEHIGGHVHVRVPAGSLLTMEVDLVPMVREDSTTAVLIQLTDVTEKRFLEHQLLQSERLASLSQFASMFAHDIRNPLAGTKKTLELLITRPEFRRKPVRHMIKDLQFTTDLLLGMINDMLDVYQESYASLPMNISRFPIIPLLEEVAHLFKGEAEAMGVSIQVGGPCEALLLPGDRRRLQRVVINLVHNALKYSPPGGTIILSIWPRQDQHCQPGHDGLHVTDLTIAVEDEGPGVDPTELPHLFELFFRKKDGQDLRIGRGLGLHFCKLVVEAHHGRIWVENKQHGGARFHVTLPVERSEYADADQTRHRRGPTSVSTEFAASA